MYNSKFLKCSDVVATLKVISKVDPFSKYLFKNGINENFKVLYGQ